MNWWKWFLFILSVVYALFLISFYFLNYYPYQRGLEFLKEKRYAEAKKEFVQFLSKNSFFFPARLNLAFLESLQENYKDALGEYTVVFEDSSDSQDRFHAYFNSAHLEAKQNNKGGALHYYQKALEERPQSVEVKTNIELMMQEDLFNARQGEGENPPPQKDKQNQSSQDQKNNNKNEQEQTDKSSLGDFYQQDSISEWKQHGDLDPDQVQSILKEIEKREQELRSKLHESAPSRKRTKQW